MPEVNVIHSLSISEQKITSIALNQTGDWIALGCSGIGQLLVWEWQSKLVHIKYKLYIKIILVEVFLRGNYNFTVLISMQIT